MTKNFAISTLGEVLIDFTTCGKSAAGMEIFERNPGGAPANVMAAVAKLGLPTAFIGSIGNDMHGEFLAETLQKANIDISGLKTIEDAFTTLAFVALNDNGERCFSFARKPGADTQLTVEHLNKDVIKNSKIFHIGSLSLTDEPIKSTTIEAIKFAKKNNVLISYDPNYRAPLWASKEIAIENMRSLLPFVDLIKISDEEIELLTGETTPEAAAKHLNKLGITCAVVTLGPKGALCSINGETQIVPTFEGPVVDTTGAGDSFWGGLLYSYLQSNKQFTDIKIADLASFARFGNAVATLCVRKRGAIPAMPSLEEVKELL